MAEREAAECCDRPITADAADTANALTTAAAKVTKIAKIANAYGTVESRRITQLRRCTQNRWHEGGADSRKRCSSADVATAVWARGGPKVSTGGPHVSDPSFRLPAF